MAGKKLGVKNWTQEELDYLQDNWGAVSVQGIAKKFGRSIEAVKLKARKLGLGDPTLYFDGITVNQLMQALNKTYNTIYRWVENYGMPVKEKLFVKEMRVKIIAYDDFWKWAEGHKELFNFAKLEPGLLGAEPEWVKVKRKADQMRSQKTWQSVAWTPQEDQRLKQMVGLSGITYPELAKQFNRSEASIKRRLYDLGIKFRPERLNNHIKYSPKEIEKLITMACQGYSYETIAQELGKSALGIRGKLERMDFDFKRREFKKVN